MNIIKSILVWLLFVAIVSCQKDIVTYDNDYDDQLTSNGTPQITKITTAQDIAIEISEAPMTQMIVLHGDNLTGVQSIKFNDVEVDLKTIYAIRGRITLPVPRVVPTDVTNTITVVTNQGSVSESFVVNIPDLQVDGFYNEFIAAGDTAIIVGKFMDLYLLDQDQGQFTLGGNPIKPLRTTSDSLYFVIPNGTADDIELTLASVLINSPMTFKFRESGISMLDFKSLNDAEKARVSTGLKAGDPKLLPGIEQFLRVRESFGAWSWNGFFWSGFNLSNSDVLANPSDYYVKFEINTKSTASISAAYFILGGDRQGSRWNPGANGVFNTYGKWKTVRLDLTSLYGDASQSNGTYLVNGWNPFVFSYQPMIEVNDDFSITNFRIVKK